MSIDSSLQPRFKLGRLIMTAGVDALIHEGRLNPLPYMRRHLRADWGDLSNEDRRRNDTALQCGDRLLSSYQVAPDLTLWIVTERDRSVTTLLLPSEY
ncbi:Type I restriction-modification system methyltransferase subunit [Burkholderia pseudomallei]|uniref:hypothetical protein n=1 Tax=Burkholderia pseudomallei TaxID=28450 RepID=UPI000F083B68|nr:hypothetical protein [Burkholderia pseudomallei]VBD50471.1 Type I restriction-modification system methyltransferase subunit [Burkholderia pseudomallei]